MNKSNKWIFGAIAVIVIAAVAYGVLTMPDRRNPLEKVGDAVHDLPQGTDKAERQLEDRTPGQKLDDTVEDAGDKVKGDATSSTSDKSQ